ncbi:hypothetical protein METBIDRAFT_46864 [Metschnikowia bicuspidata var. bicuspidata NRRL YB-4993]|uniref:CTLH domain-containing protein n=1 Tax=Metschnikowia bicuspidata var. bicuspidata NRRL YB-4993 TaxID=869754 RepID=A0A1A0H5B4_9ASCO|nr:hypothetical protein METBIDRAFT_46864 [Metschnikowia bicuspidata var. bicuspidata NRRL YB-4993]OBA19274.1 hypothetical protein METBIDRAFT_46864 [Metschnikowia bicuspidata var. bicuspidata NRRL YB-4993]
MQQDTPCKSHGIPNRYNLFRFSQSEPEKKVAKKTRLKEKINNVILEYLVQEGYQSAALKLAEEASISKPNSELSSGEGYELLELDYPQIPSDVSKGLSNPGQSFTAFQGKGPEIGYVRGFSSIEIRRQLKFLILRGDISQAIRVISACYPTILDANNLLLFKLLRLNLVEMIRSHKSTSDRPLSENHLSIDEDSEKKFLNDILTFVRENLLNKVTHSMDLLRQLEVTMSLLCFDFDHKKPSNQITELPEELRKLLDLSHRNECYRAVNKVILDLDRTVQSDVLYRGVSLEAVSLSLTQVDGLAQNYEDVDDLDSSDIELNPGLDVVSSIQSMISSVPETSTQAEPVVAATDEDCKSSSEEAYSHSKLEEIAKLWLATELILFLDNLIPKKRYLQDSTGGNQRL